VQFLFFFEKKKKRQRSNRFFLLPKSLYTDNFKKKSKHIDRNFFEKKKT